VRIVPKFSATLASLLLIASSIGVNIARYPQVGRTVDAGQRTDAAGTVTPAQTVQQPRIVETANLDSLPASETRIESARSSQVAAVAPTENPRGEGSFNPKPAVGTALSQPLPAVPILDVRPMVPIANLPAAAAAADPLAAANQVQRLPPVEPTVSAAGEFQAARPDEAGQYPATSTP
jgi:hypothetical protein